MPRAFLTAEWRDLVLVNYAVAPELLRPLVPAGTTIDLWDGAAFVSLVGFRFVSTRVLGIGFPGHRAFPEVNLRFYVRRDSGREPRRAVVFIRELVPRRAIAWVARALYNEPYRALPMRDRIESTGERRMLSYEWHEPAGWVGVTARTDGPATALLPGSKAEFITEHFWGYTRQRDGGTVEYEVAHPRWEVWTEPEITLHGDLRGTYGPVFGSLLAQPPDSAFVAVGSAITVFSPRRLVVDALRTGAA